MNQISPPRKDVWVFLRQQEKELTVLGKRYCHSQDKRLKASSAWITLANESLWNCSLCHILPQKHSYLSFLAAFTFGDILSQATRHFLLGTYFLIVSTSKLRTSLKTYLSTEKKKTCFLQKLFDFLGFPSPTCYILRFSCKTDVFLSNCFKFSQFNQIQQLCAKYFARCHAFQSSVRFQLWVLIQYCCQQETRMMHCSY